MISIENLEIRLKGFKKIYKNFSIDEREVLMISGDNGLGKTVLLNAICNLVDCEKGSVKIKNSDNKLEYWKEYTGVFLDRSFLIPYLNANEYFDLVLSLSNRKIKSGNKLIKKYSEKLFFTEFNKQIKYLSHRNQKKVGIISTLITKPSLIIWDEPFAYLDKKTSINLNGIMMDLSNSDTTIIFTNHAKQETFYNKIYELNNV